MSVIVGKVISIFLIMAVGLVANKIGILPTESKKYIVDLLILITTPCMVFTSITSKELTDDTIPMTLQTIGLAICIHIFCLLLGYVLFKKVFKVHPAENLGAYMFSFGSFNTGFMGFPITLALFGKDILYLMVMLNSMLCLYMYTFGPMILKIGSDEKKKLDIRSLLVTLKNPNTSLTIIGLVMLFTGLHLPAIPFECMETLGQATVPVSMLIVGMHGKGNVGLAGCSVNPVSDGTRGAMKTGWLKDADGSWYYLNPVSDGTQGAMKTGWFTDPQDGHLYYLDPKTGAMVTGNVQNDHM